MTEDSKKLPVRDIFGKFYDQEIEDNKADCQNPAIFTIHARNQWTQQIARIQPFSHQIHSFLTVSDKIGID